MPSWQQLLAEHKDVHLICNMIRPDLLCKRPPWGLFRRAAVKRWRVRFKSSGPLLRISVGNLGQVWTNRPSAAFTQVPVVLAALHSSRRQSAASAGYYPVGIDITVQMQRSMSLTRQRACIAKVAVRWEEKKTIAKLNWEEKENIIWRVNVVEIATLSRRGWLRHRSKPLPVGLKNDVKSTPPVFSNDSKCLHSVSGRHFFCFVLLFLHRFSEKCVVKPVVLKQAVRDVTRDTHSFSRLSLQGAVNTGRKLLFHTDPDILA